MAPLLSINKEAALIQADGFGQGSGRDVEHTADFVLYQRTKERREKREKGPGKSLAHKI